MVEETHYLDKYKYPLEAPAYKDKEYFKGFNAAIDFLQPFFDTRPSPRQCDGDVELERKLKSAEHFVKVLADRYTMRETAGYQDATDCFNALRTAHGHLTQAWMPIETAPRDGTWIYAWWPTMKITDYPAVVFYEQGVYSNPNAWSTVASHGYGPEEVYPVKWLPLPPAPQGEK